MTMTLLGLVLQHIAGCDRCHEDAGGYVDPPPATKLPDEDHGPAEPYGDHPTGMPFLKTAPVFTAGYTDFSRKNKKKG